ncbi:MAG TPA: SRPBCC domain-containing protein [Candidatus Saccharimonadales bacterium]|nr:SRPBCC domain-containing protein [Candidatus Saccharimonadales bacterium]
MQNKLPEPLVITRTLNAPIASVWNALTDPTTLKKWMPFFPDFKAEVGFETRFMLGASPDRQYEHICHVTEVETEKKLTHSWRYEGIPGDAYVTYELAPAGEQTHLTLTYRITEMFPVNDENQDLDIKNAVYGWNHFADSLKEFVEA